MPGVIKRESNQFLVLFALWLLVFSASSQLMIVVAMLPVIGKQLQIPEAGQGWLVSVYALMVGLFALGIGSVSDKFGRRRVLLIGAGLMTGALALHAVATLMSLTVSIGQIGFAFGGSVAGLIYSNFGYASSTIIGAAMVLTMALLVWRFIPETVNSQSKSEPHTPPEKSIYASASNIGH